MVLSQGVPGGHIEQTELDEELRLGCKASRKWRDLTDASMCRLCLPGPHMPFVYIIVRCIVRCNIHTPIGTRAAAVHIITSPRALGQAECLELRCFPFKAQPLRIVILVS